MQRRPAALSVSVLLLLTAFAAACSDTVARDSLTQPTAVSDQSSITFSAESPSVVAQVASQPGSGSGSGCNAHPSFIIPLGLVVRVNRNVRVFVTTVTMQFRDPFNITMPQVTLPAPQLTRQFGTNLVEARSARTFALTLPVGCGIQRLGGMATIAVDTEDANGRRDSGQVSVAVR